MVANSQHFGVPCSECGAPAVHCTRDIKEGFPRPDAQGRLWAYWEYDGPMHFRCDIHYRAPKKTRLDPEVVKHCKAAYGFL